MSIGTDITVIESIERHKVGERDEYLEIKHDGWTFVGVLERNCFRDGSVDEERTLSWLLQPTAITRWWGGIGRPIHQIEVLVEDAKAKPLVLGTDSAFGDWLPVWDTTNDFRTIEESKADGSAYADFIEREADVIASRIDAGEDPQTVDENMDGDHSGNTAAWAWNLGCSRAKDQERAQVFRDWWNNRFAPDQNVAPGGLVNPAVLHIGDDS